MPSNNTLPNTLGEVIGYCQSNWGDKTGRMISRNYAVPFIQQAYSAMVKEIKNATGKNLEAVVEVLNIPNGTSNLYPYQTMGNPTSNPIVQRGPLAGLFDPLRMWVKTAGALPQYYTPAVGPRDTLPHVNPPGALPTSYAVRVTFAWIGNKLCMTPVAGPIDIQIYGRFNPPRLQQDTDPLVIYDDCSEVLALKASAMMAVERSNPAILAGYAAAASAGIDNIVADLIRQTQREPRRLAKLGGCGGSYWGWN